MKNAVHAKSKKKYEVGISLCGLDTKYRNTSDDPNDWTCTSCLSIHHHEILLENGAKPIHGITNKSILRREQKRRKNYLD